MELLNKREIVNIQLFNAEISESELRIYRLLFLKALENMNAKEIEEYFDAESGELEGMLNDIESIEEAGLLAEETSALEDEAKV
jgi:anion-transporting  ArsA/GET3 family ATPase